jgi:acyl-CoA synthetase (AMP-forming)/AMP-acid ligase II
LARFKIPRYVWFVEWNEWPLTGTGKIQKFLLRDMAIARIQQISQKQRELEASTNGQIPVEKPVIPKMESEQLGRK